MSDDILKRVAGAEILFFPRAAAPSGAGASTSSARPESTRPGDVGASPAGPARDDRGGRGSDDGADRLDLACARLPLTDLGNAERFTRRFRDRLRYCAAIGWLAWDGRRWERDEAEHRVKLAEHATVRAIQAEAQALRDSGDDVQISSGKWWSDKLAAWGRTSEGAQKMAAISKRAAAMLAIPSDQLDVDPMRINVLNGTLHVAQRRNEPYIKLLPHDPEDFITKLCPVEYQPNAACPLFDRFMDDVHPWEEGVADNAMQLFLDQWGGLALTGETGEQKMVFFYGKGRNGKGVWVNIVAWVAGDYADSIQIDSFMDSGRARSGGQATPDLAGIVGVRFLTTSEPKKGATIDECLIKQFTGGDPIKARFLNKDFFEFVPTAKLTMQGNYRPKITGTDEGIWGRVQLVPWAQFIPPERRDKKLAEKLKAEGSGILNRLLHGLSLYLDKGLCIPPEVSQATDQYRSDSDPLGRFLDACTKQDLGKRVQSTDLYSVYEAWANANGEAVWSAKGFGGAMQERGIARKKSDVVFWLDLSLTKGVADFVDVNGVPLHRRRGRDEEDDPRDRDA